MSWNPGQYLKFAEPRFRPGLDLMARVPDLPARRVVDLGCGTGQLTAMLSARFPQARTTGVDNSRDMLAKARAEHPAESWPHLDWHEADIASWAPEEPLDLLFSNAALQWVTDHRTLFPRLLQCVAPGGILAVQVPTNFSAPSHVLLRKTVEERDLSDRITLRHDPVLTAEGYYDLLAPRAARVEIWETEYLHVLEGKAPVLEWVRATALRPVLDVLSGPELDRFLDDYGRRLDEAYPRRADGSTLFPFRRLFLLAQAPA